MLSLFIFITLIMVTLFGVYFLQYQKKPEQVIMQKPINIIKRCEEIYLLFVMLIKKRQFNELANICSMNLLNSIVQITDINVPLSIYCKSITTTNNYIMIEFWGNTPFGQIKDVCMFMLDYKNIIKLVQFNGVGRYESYN